MRRIGTGLLPLALALGLLLSACGGKDQGMDAILAHFGIPLEATMAFGDGENDLPMLRHARIGVAMGNADCAVKEQAGYVTASVDEDGILPAEGTVDGVHFTKDWYKKWLEFLMCHTVDQAEYEAGREAPAGEGAEAE